MARPGSDIGRSLHPFMLEYAMSFTPTLTKQKQRGQGMTEYIIIVALIAVAAIGVYQLFGNTVRNQTAALAKEYLDYLYSDEAQEIAAQHALRPRNEAILKKYVAVFKPIQLFTVNELFGSLGEAQKVHFNDGGQFDKIYTLGAK